MRRRLVVGLLFAVFAAAHVAIADPSGEATGVELLVSLSSADRSADTRLRSARPAQQQVTVAPTQRPASLPRHRDPTISEQHLVLVVADAAGRELDRTLVADPRLVRAETTDADGRLTSVALWRPTVTFRAVVPRSPHAAELLVYQPRWTGTEMRLDLLGRARLR